ncbi:integrase core domain protein [Lasius niger]|uniref:Integrase core domain protein n=1 Tax=Lasius niger TaxID=67767 RepID=A0A0J7KEM7_LASNI|nr:integrase core domain protein [Lasius niger]
MLKEIFGRGITKFNGTDYLTWKFEVMQMLMVHGLDDLIDDSRPRPDGERNVPAVKAWVKNNAKAMSLISSAIEKRQLQSMITCTTAKQMWDNLQSMYEQRSSSKYVTAIQNLASQLKDVGEVISEIDIMANILGTLPPKYNALVTA